MWYVKCANRTVQLNFLEFTPCFNRLNHTLAHNLVQSLLVCSDLFTLLQQEFANLIFRTGRFFTSCSCARHACHDQVLGLEGHVASY
jgi:hypothetical protein